MTWTAETPIYLPLTDPPTIRAAAERLADAVAAVLGARPPLCHQPAPFGRPAILLAPDPAYSPGVAPDEPGTYTLLTHGEQLIITGADSAGTEAGIEWLMAEVVPGLGAGREVVLGLSA